MRRWTCFPSRRRGRSLSTGFVPAIVSGVLGSMKDSWRWKGSPVVWLDSLMGTLVGEEKTGRSWTGAHPADWQIYSTLRKVRVLKEARKKLVTSWSLVYAAASWCFSDLVFPWRMFNLKVTCWCLAIAVHSCFECSLVCVLSLVAPKSCGFSLVVLG